MIVMIVILLGLPASAKSTHGKTISEVFGLNIISPGFLLRQLALQNKHIRECLSTGGLVDEQISNKIVQDELKKHNYKCIIDGYPRTITQAESLTEFLKQNKDQEVMVVNLKINPEESIKRLTNRYSCVKCNRSYDKKTMCCKIETTKREDDSHEVIHKRVMNHEELGKPVENFYKNMGIFINVDGSVTEEESKQKNLSPQEIVGRRVVDAIKKYFEKKT